MKNHRRAEESDQGSCILVNTALLTKCSSATEGGNWLTFVGRTGSSLGWISLTNVDALSLLWLMASLVATSPIFYSLLKLLSLLPWCALLSWSSRMMFRLWLRFPPPLPSSYGDKNWVLLLLGGGGAGGVYNLPRAKKKSYRSIYIFILIAGCDSRLSFIFIWDSWRT